MKHEKRIAVWKLLPEEIDMVASCLPARGIDIVEVTCAADLIAMSWLAILVNADAMVKDDREMLYGFYQEAGETAKRRTAKISVPPWRGASGFLAISVPRLV